MAEPAPAPGTDYERDTYARDAPAAPPPGSRDDTRARMAEHTREILGEQEQFGREQEQLLESQRAQKAPFYQRLMRATDAPMPQPPALHGTPQFKEPNTDAMWGWVQASALFGALAGFAGRKSATTALTAMGAMNKGIYEGNLQAYEQAYKTWEANARKATEDRRAAIEQYNMILKRRDLDIDQKMAELRIVAEMHRDELTASAAAHNNFTQVAEIVQKGDQNLATLDYHYDMITGHHDDMRMRMDIELAKAGLKLDENGQIAPDTSPDSPLERNAKAIADYKMAPLSSSGTKNPINRITMARVMELNPDYNVQTWNSTNAAAVSRARVVGSADVRADANALNKLVAQRAAISAFEQTAKANGRVLIYLADKVDKTGSPVIERWTRAGRQNVQGDPDVSNFNLQYRLYTAEVAKIITNPNLTGVLSDTARREVSDGLAPSASARQIRAAVKLLEQDFDRRTGPLDEQIRQLQTRLQAASQAQQPGAPGAGTAPGAPAAAPGAAPDHTNMSDEDLKKALGLP